jgi:hypothetical protein
MGREQKEANMTRVYEFALTEEERDTLLTAIKQSRLHLCGVSEKLNPGDYADNDTIKLDTLEMVVRNAKMIDAEG